MKWKIVVEDGDNGSIWDFSNSKKDNDRWIWIFKDDGKLEFLRTMEDGNGLQMMKNEDDDKKINGFK